MCMRGNIRHGGMWKFVADTFVGVGVSVREWAGFVGGGYGCEMRGCGEEG